MKHLILLLFLVSISCGSNQETKKVEKTEVSSCIQNKITQFSSEKMTNPPRKIYQYTYNNKIVYLITAPCCDNFEQLIDANCQNICAPSGGFTGKGDGKCTDFYKIANNKKLIWEDARKSSKK